MNFLLTLSLATLLAAPAPNTESAPFSVGITTLTQSGKLRVAIDKTEPLRLWIRITQADGQTLLEEYVGRK